MRNDIRVYGDETIYFSVRIEDGVDEDSLAPVDISTAAITAHVKANHNIVTTFDVLVRDQNDPANLGWVDLSLPSSKMAILRDHRENVFTYDVRLTLDGQIWYPVESSEITTVMGVTVA